MGVKSKKGSQQAPSMSSGPSMDTSEDFGSNTAMQDLMLSASEESEEGSHDDVMETIQEVKTSIREGISDEEVGEFAADVLEVMKLRKPGKPADAGEYGNTLAELGAEKNGFTAIRSLVSGEDGPGHTKLGKAASKAETTFAKLIKRYKKRYAKTFDR